ncbi:unnamed protein product [Ceratitis capitata]|uniref:(Mediterranean fruit fly) hypothetical protein n=1 Tax=Ceratitis capitata TaxID=7213 RepID=A0A811UDL3_CERCA|nr:unnamed protein product [Ceratitis capitata]
MQKQTEAAMATVPPTTVSCHECIPCRETTLAEPIRAAAENATMLSNCNIKVEVMFTTITFTYIDIHTYTNPGIYMLFSLYKRANITINLRQKPLTGATLMTASAWCRQNVAAAPLGDNLSSDHSSCGDKLQ